MEPRIKTIIIRSEEGRITESSIVEKPLVEAVKEITMKALEEWNPASSDFTVLRAAYELRYSIPLKNPDIIDFARELNLEMRREGNELVIVIPVYTISFENEWREDSYMDKKMYIIGLYVDEDSVRQLEEYAKEATKGPKKITGEQISLSEAELKALEEGLQELEAEEKEEKKKKRRTRRSRRKKE